MDYLTQYEAIRHLQHVGLSREQAATFVHEQSLMQDLDCLYDARCTYERFINAGFSKSAADVLAELFSIARDHHLGHL